MELFNDHIKSNSQKFNEENGGSNLLSYNLENNKHEFIFQLQKENLNLQKLNETLIHKITGLESELTKRTQQISELELLLNKIKEEENKNKNNLSSYNNLEKENEILRNEYFSIKKEYDELFLKFEFFKKMKKNDEDNKINKITFSKNFFPNAANSPRNIEINKKEIIHLNNNNLNKFDHLSWY
jgi:predicted RNase H-like nuclease (RuvC/YqgF family)